MNPRVYLNTHWKAPLDGNKFLVAYSLLTLPWAFTFIYLGRCFWGSEVHLGSGFFFCMFLGLATLRLGRYLKWWSYGAKETP